MPIRASAAAPSTGPASLRIIRSIGEPGQRRQHHADQRAHRRAEPVDGLRVRRARAASPCRRRRSAAGRAPDRAASRCDRGRRRRGRSRGSRAATARANASKSFDTRVSPWTQTSTRSLSGSPHSRYAMRWSPAGEMHWTSRSLEAGRAAMVLEVELGCAMVAVRRDHRSGASNGRVRRPAEAVGRRLSLPSGTRNCRSCGVRISALLRGVEPAPRGTRLRLSRTLNMTTKTFDIDSKLVYEVNGPAEFFFQIEAARIPEHTILSESFDVTPFDRGCRASTCRRTRTTARCASMRTPAPRRSYTSARVIRRFEEPDTDARRTDRSPNCPTR